MTKATSCGGVVIFRGKILLLYKNYRNKYEGWVLPKGTATSPYFTTSPLLCSVHRTDRSIILFSSPEIALLEFYIFTVSLLKDLPLIRKFQ